MSVSLEEIPRNYIRFGAKKLGIEDRLDRFITYIKHRGTKCAEGDVISHYVDSIFIPILSNSDHLAVAVSNRDVPGYWRNRFTKALGTRDRSFIRWFLQNYVYHYTDVDDLVSQNYMVLPWFFGFTFNVCPITGGACANNACCPCASLAILPQTGLCCTSCYIYHNSKYFNLVDAVPWVNKYSTNKFGLSATPPQSQGTFTVTGNVTTPLCFPNNGVTLDLDLIEFPYSACSVTCSTTCPSGTACITTNVPYCPSSTYNEGHIPVLYYKIGLVALPNSSYSVWWSVSVS